MTLRVPNFTALLVTSSHQREVRQHQEKAREVRKSADQQNFFKAVRKHRRSQGSSEHERQQIKRKVLWTILHEE